MAKDVNARKNLKVQFIVFIQMLYRFSLAFKLWS